MRAELQRLGEAAAGGGLPAELGSLTGKIEGTASLVSELASVVNGAITGQELLDTKVDGNAKAIGELQQTALSPKPAAVAGKTAAFTALQAKTDATAAALADLCGKFDGAPWTAAGPLAAELEELRSAFGGELAELVERVSRAEENPASGGKAEELETAETLTVTCPDGVQPGDALAVATDGGGQIEVVVPEGVECGDTFEVTLIPLESQLEVEDEDGPAGESGPAAAAEEEEGGEGLPRLQVLDSRVASLEQHLAELVEQATAGSGDATAAGAAGGTETAGGGGPAVDASGLEARLSQMEAETRKGGYDGLERRVSELESLEERAALLGKEVATTAGVAEGCRKKLQVLEESMWEDNEVSHGLQLPSLWIVPTAAVG